jgi:hypothetical protein
MTKRMKVGRVRRNVRNGETMMEEMVRRRLVPCVQGRCIQCESFVCGAIVDEKKKKVMKKQRRSERNG